MYERGGGGEEGEALRVNERKSGREVRKYGCCKGRTEIELEAV